MFLNNTKKEAFKALFLPRSLKQGRNYIAIMLKGRLKERDKVKKIICCFSFGAIMTSLYNIVYKFNFYAQVQKHMALL